MARPATGKTVKAIEFICGTYKPLNIEDDISSAFLALLERKYWRRLWIFQEILIARDVAILCEPSQLPWYLLEEHVANVTRTHQILRDIVDGQARSIINDKASQGQPFKPFLDLGIAIFKYRHQECADVRDKVYGLLGLVDFKDMEPIMPDYSLSAEEVCELVSTYLRKDPRMKKSEADFLYADECRRMMDLSFTMQPHREI
jgi:hypothetical protein